MPTARFSCEEFLAESHPGHSAADAPALLAAGLDLYREGDLPGASETFRAAAEADPSLAEAWNNAGIVRGQLGDAAGSAADFAQAIAARPGYAEARNNLARALQAMDDPSALAEFDQALGYAVGDFRAVVLQNRAMLRQELGDLTGAVADLTAALEIVSDRVATLLGRGSARKDAGDLDGALDDFEAALALAHGAERAAALHGRGGVRTLRKDFEGAVADYDLALRIDPRYLAAMISRGHARYHLRDPRALDDYRRAQALDPEGTLRELARFCLDDVARDPEGVLKNCDQHLRINPQDVVARARRGLALAILGRDPIRDLMQFSVLAPDLVESLNQLLELARRMNRRAAPHSA
jgi:tetratricopeptide (TPR) repeat protein